LSAIAAWRTPPSTGVVELEVRDAAGLAPTVAAARAPITARLMDRFLDISSSSYLSI
jgi:hypothetical protein